MGTGTIRSGLRTFGGKAGDFVADRIDDVMGKPKRESENLSRRTAEEDEYDPNSARLEETRRINDSLREFTRNLEPVADKFEQDCLHMCQEGIKNLVQDIKVVNNQKIHGKELNINIDRLERKLSQIEKTIKGSMKKRLSKKVSIDDAECLSILKMPKGSAKEKAMNKFANNVFQKALVELSESIKDIVTDQCEIITEQIADRLEDITTSLQRMTEQYGELEMLKGKDVDEIEHKKVDLVYTIALCELGLALTEQSKEKVTV